MYFNVLMPYKLALNYWKLQNLSQREHWLELPKTEIWHYRSTSSVRPVDRNLAESEKK